MPLKETLGRNNIGSDLRHIEVLPLLKLQTYMHHFYKQILYYVMLETIYFFFNYRPPPMKIGRRRK